MQHLVPGNEVHPLHVDLRATGWMQPYQGQFDAVVSLTALHWLSPEHLQQLYRGILGVLKPGGRLVVGDPYLPADPVERAQLKAFQDERMASEPGATWSEFWAGFFTRYPIEEAYTRYHLFIGYQEPFEGAEDGYSLSFYEESLTQAGFESISVFWMGGLRIVYGGAKPVQ
jgi:SAM-dependent methyltransferase